MTTLVPAQLGVTAGSAAQIGVNAFGSPIFLTGDSPDLRRLMRWPYSRKQWVA